MSRRERTLDPVEHHRASTAQIGGLFQHMARPEQWDGFDEGFLPSQRERPAIRLDDPEWLLRPTTRLEWAFHRFHASQPQVYAALEEAALNRLATGATRIAINDLTEDLRKTAPPQHGERYAVNNSHRALFARLIIHRNPQLKAVIETRARTERKSA